MDESLHYLIMANQMLVQKSLIDQRYRPDHRTAQDS